MSEPEDQKGKGTEKAWDEVGERFSEVGRKVGEHYRKLGAKAGAAADLQSQAVRDAVKEAIAELDRALTAVGDALRDEDTKNSLKQAARSFGDAVSATFSDLGEEIRKRVKGKDSGPENSSQ
jgi:DNA-binding ferritin-like protein